MRIWPDAFSVQRPKGGIADRINGINKGGFASAIFPEYDLDGFLRVKLYRDGLSCAPKMGEFKLLDSVRHGQWLK
jgi:hypothetical protein